MPPLLKVRRAPRAERWLSGRKHRTRNAAYGQPYRGFESHPLRQHTDAPSRVGDCPDHAIRAGEFIDGEKPHHSSLIQIRFRNGKVVLTFGASVDGAPPARCA